MITRDDAILAISWSGETVELKNIITFSRRFAVPLIAMTSRQESALGQAANIVLELPRIKEACPHGLAPTTSTTIQLALGDALAVALLESRGFTREDFARSHPAGVLGRRLLLYVSDIMHTGKDIPLVRDDAKLREALFEMTGKGLGMTGVVDAADRLVGILTDGDLRRLLNRELDLNSAKVRDVMVRNPKVTQADVLAAETVKQMEALKINGLFVVDAERRVVGALNVHDLLRAGVM
jgi:arabinose-5-phosphate isomerase